MIPWVLRATVEHIPSDIPRFSASSWQQRGSSCSVPPSFNNVDISFARCRMLKSSAVLTRKAEFWLTVVKCRSAKQIPIYSRCLNFSDKSRIHYWKKFLIENERTTRVVISIRILIILNRVTIDSTAKFWFVYFLDKSRIPIKSNSLFRIKTEKNILHSNCSQTPQVYCFSTCFQHISPETLLYNLMMRQINLAKLFIEHHRISIVELHKCSSQARNLIPIESGHTKGGGGEGKEGGQAWWK